MTDLATPPAPPEERPATYDGGPPWDGFEEDDCDRAPKIPAPPTWRREP